MAQPDRPIDPSILEALGITQELIDSQVGRKHQRLMALCLDLGRQQFARLLEEEGNRVMVGSAAFLIRPWGEDIDNVSPETREQVETYRPLIEGIPDRIIIPENRRGLLESIPDAVWDHINPSTLAHQRYLAAMKGHPIPDEVSSIDLDETKTIASNALKGFGFAALEAGRYEVAINALEYATRGEYFEYPDVSSRLITIAQADKVAGMEIARFIQNRVDIANADFS